MNTPLIPGGYFIISKLIFGSKIWSDDVHLLKLFVWLIGRAHHEDEPKYYPHATVNRGEVLTSLEHISEQNEYSENNTIKRWSRMKVSRMLAKLEEQGYIIRACDTYGTHVKVCNYEKYQDASLYARDKPVTPALQLVTPALPYKNALEVKQGD